MIIAVTLQLICAFVFAIQKQVFSCHGSNYHYQRNILTISTDQKHYYGGSKFLIELHVDKTNKHTSTSMPSENSDKLRHLPSLISLCCELNG